MQITVAIKNVYGNNLAYPVCEKAKLFAQLGGARTLTKSSLDKIESLGYVVLLKHPCGQLFDIR